MKSGNFELEIVGGLEAPDTCRVEMRHRQVYQIKPTNHDIVDCLAIVNIDGEQMGRWVVGATEAAVIEGPVDGRGRFTFFRAGSEEARQTVPEDAHESGIVGVWFVPAFDDPDDEDEQPGGGTLFSFSLNAAEADRGNDEAAGVTGFTGQVQQNPSQPPPRRRRWDTESAVLIELRLVSEPIPAAAYEKVSYTVYDCPDCNQPSKVPAGMGSLRIKCPACFCLFIRQT